MYENIDPKYAFLHAFFLIVCHVLSKICLYDQKHTFFLFFPILHFFAPLNDVRAYSTWSWKTTLITWIFGRAWYPLDILVPPPNPDKEKSTLQQLWMWVFLYGNREW